MLLCNIVITISDCFL